MLCFIIAYLTLSNFYTLDEHYTQGDNNIFIIYLHYDLGIYNFAFHKLDPKKRKLVCYYNLPGMNDSLQPDHLDPNLCTHIIIGFVEIKNNSIEIEETNFAVS